MKRLIFVLGLIFLATVRVQEPQKRVTVIRSTQADLTLFTKTVIKHIDGRLLTLEDITKTSRIPLPTAVITVEARSESLRFLVEHHTVGARLVHWKVDFSIPVENNDTAAVIGETAFTQILEIFKKIVNAERHRLILKPIPHTARASPRGVLFRSYFKNNLLTKSHNFEWIGL
jgi:hypothetical protein